MIRDLSKTNEKDTVVGENVIVTGKLHTSSNIQINGHVKGEVSSEGTIIVGKNATIEGPVIAADILIHGTVKGNIVAKSGLEMTSGGKVFGDIETKSLSIQSGAIFIGKSIMGEEKSKISPDKSKQEKTTGKENQPEMEIE